MGDKNFRLPSSIRPTRYRFLVTPDLNAGTFTGKGTVEIALSAPTRAITLHGVKLTVERAAASSAAGAVTVDQIEYEADSQTITFALGAELPAGNATLDLAWRGGFQTDLRGLYLAGGIAVTQFEAADARRVFPCFDEPPFKAEWHLSIAAPRTMIVLGNGFAKKEDIAGDTRTVHLSPTRPISSYLVAFIVGRLVSSEAAQVDEVTVRTWCAPEKLELTGFAQECAAAVLPRLASYFDHHYVFGKVDQVAIPDFEAGAMENAGCITYREIALLVDEKKAPLSARKRVAEVITHELAHQWFGNLVTMQWWDDLWLNEAFATWMAYKIVDQWKPGWRMWDDFELGKAEALHLDALDSTHPIRADVKNADQATENFDAITYEKGGAMLRMIEGYLGEERFRDGIRTYMKQYSYRNAVADDLWGALAEASKQPIAELANAWIGRSGYPLVSARLDADGRTVKLSQRRFQLDPERFRSQPDEPWLLPVVVRFGDDKGVKEARVLLRDREGELELPATGAVKFVCANSRGAGFYRVEYTAEGWRALREHAASLTPAERMNLVADAWALFRAGAAPLSPLLDLSFAFLADTDYAVLGEVVARLDALERRFMTPADRPRLRRLVDEALRPQLEAEQGGVGWDAKKSDDDARRLRRAQILRGLALVARSPKVIGEARARVDRAFGGDAGALDPNLLDVSTMAAARAGDPVLFAELLGRTSSDPDPAAKRRYLVALASFEDPALAGRAIELLLDAAVPMQDVTTYVAALFNNDAARDRAFAHLRAEWPRVREKAKAPMLTRRLVESLGSLLHLRADVEAFLDERAADLASAPQTVAQTRERLRLDEDVHARAAKELREWLEAHHA